MRRSGIGYGGTPLRRLRRRLGLEPSPLRRRVDRVQRAIALALLVLLLGIAPLFAAWAASWSYQAGVRAEKAERADRRQVVATVTSIGTSSAGDPYLHQTVQATWPGPGGKTRVGTLPSWKNAEIGAKRTIWVDQSGDPTVRPRPHSRTVTDSAYAGTAAAVGGGLPILLVYVLVRNRCDRHRDRLWEADWARMDADANPRS